MIMNSIDFPLCALFIIILLNVLFFGKKRINILETQIYKKIIIYNLLECLFAVLGLLLINKIGNTNFTKKLVKIDYCLMLLWGSAFAEYVVSISYLNKNIFNNLKKLIVIIYAILIFGILLSPVNLILINNTIDSNGLSMQILLLGAVIYIFMIFVSVINMIVNKNFGKNQKKLFPLFCLIIILVILMLMKTFLPHIIIQNLIFSFVSLIMYFTIENPDVKMIEQLEVARDQANKANQAKTDFLSSMSHEIRTPLNAIVGFSDCIMDAKDLDEAKENAHDIVNASQTLLEIVNGILDISKIEAGKIEIVNSKYNALETFNELAKLITPKMREKGLDFSFNIAEDLPNALFGDHANIKKVITNLLSNACKYTDRGFVHYEVNCVNSNGVCKLIISVEDSGQGIKKEDVDKLFTKFQRLDEEKNATIEGTGLGLAITKQLVELMGGRIIVHTLYGKGSKFTVVLNQKIEDMEVQETKKIKTTLDLHDVKILLVDDTALNLKVATKLLERYNANSIVTCSSGYACLEKIKNGDVFDIILLDDMMPHLSGIETLKKLKEVSGFNIPVVVLTANAISGMREKYLADGFDDYLAKPIEKEQLILVINNILGRSITETIEIPKEKIEEAEEEIDVKPIDIIPVVDIDIPTETIEKVDRSYLESNGVDVDHALELLGDMDMYSEVEDKWNRITQYRDSNDMENYAIEVHSLKSDCKYLGFMTLADVAYEHELKSKENDSSFVNDNFKRLEDEYKKVLVIARTYVENNPIQ